MIKHTFKAEKRELLGRKVNVLRRKGLIPASLFGKEVKSQNISLPVKEFIKIYALVGESGLVYLTIGEGKTETPVIFSEVARHPVSDDVLHVSLRQVSLSEKIKAPVKVELTGKSPAVTDGLGVLVQQTDEIEVEALPQDFPENITIDISSLSEVDASICVKDLKISTKLSIVTDPETILVSVAPLAKEEVVAPPVVEEVAPIAEGTAPTEEPKPATEDKK